MGTKILLMFFGVIFQFCNVLGRHNFYEYYYSRYHKDHSTTTESIPSSTSDIFSSSEHKPELSPSDYISWENTKDWIPTTDDNSLQNNLYEITDDDTSLQNNKYEPTVYPFIEYEPDYSPLKIGVIIAGVVILLSAICCVLCCIRHCCCSRTERRGFIVGGRAEPAREVVPQQSALQRAELQQPYHPAQGYDHFYPPQYHPQPMQQFPPMQPQFQYSPSAPMQTHNPPEAPPPYEFPQKF